MVLLFKLLPLSSKPDLLSCSVVLWNSTNQVYALPVAPGEALPRGDTRGSLQGWRREKGLALHISPVPISRGPALEQQLLEPVVVPSTPPEPGPSCPLRGLGASLAGPSPSV